MYPFLFNKKKLYKLPKKKRWLKQKIKKKYTFFPLLEILWHKKKTIHSTGILFWLLLYFCLYLFAKTEYFSKTPKPHRVEFSSSIQSDLLLHILFFFTVGVVLFYLCMVLYLYGDLAIYAVAVPKSLRDVLW